MDHRLADEATRVLVALARSYHTDVAGPIPLPVSRNKLEPEEPPALLSPQRVRGPVFKRILRISSPSDDAVLAITNAVLPAGVQSRIRML